MGDVQFEDGDWLSSFLHSDLTRHLDEAPSGLPLFDDLPSIDSDLPFPSVAGSGDVSWALSGTVDFEDFLKAEVTNDSLFGDDGLRVSSDKGSSRGRPSDPDVFDSEKTGSSDCGCMRENISAAASNRSAHILSSSKTSRKRQGSPETIDAAQKKQFRLLRNRELALESRQRKKSYVKGLEIKCKLLEKERNMFQQHASIIYTENMMLREEIARLKRGSNGATEPAVLKDSLPLEFLLSLAHLTLWVWASLVQSLFLACFLLQNFKGMTEVRLAKGLAESELDMNSLYACDFSHHSVFFTSSVDQRAHSYWRRRIKTVQLPTSCIGIDSWYTRGGFAGLKMLQGYLI